MQELPTDAIASILATPELAQNFRGQLYRVLGLLDQKWHKSLACDFTEHILWIAERSRLDYDFGADLKLIRDFIDRNSELFHVYRNIQSKSDPGYEAALNMIWSLHLTYLVCCQRELEKTGEIFRNKYQPDATSVAGYAATAVMNFPQRTEPETFERKKAHELRAAEFNWQLDHTLRIIGYHKP
ncbi:MAG TPA: hypothetical protein VHL11_02545 [Phototrophicaceae bacterium]|jgi:hypothetical protein|nr:hypothetical protein [Phototrophicaceae bacterium]